MASYKGFAKLYDRFMQDIPYDEWGRRILDLFDKYGVKGRVLELGCGTGELAKRLTKAGLEVTGIDLSPEMIEVAKKKKIEGLTTAVWDMRIPYIQDSQDFSAVVSLCDSMNYLLKRSDVLLTFKAAYEKLCDGGIFVFDLKTHSFYKNELADGIFADNQGDVSYIWENFYDEEKHLNIYDITFYQKAFGPFYRKFTEHHVQRAYSEKFIDSIAEECSFEQLEIFAADERKYYVYRKVSK